MKKLNIIAKGRKPAFGHTKDFNYAVNIASLDRNDFFYQNFGHQLSDLRRIEEWKKTAKKDWVDAKGIPTMKAVRAWVKENKPIEFYAKWTPDSSHNKDDSVEIYYK